MMMVSFLIPLANQQARPKGTRHAFGKHFLPPAAIVMGGELNPQ